MSLILQPAQLFIAKPKILPGEIITGYIARLAPFAVQGGIETTLRYQGKGGHRLPWLLPSGLEQLARLYGPSVPPAEHLLTGHTVFPLLRPFLPKNVLASLRAHFLENSAPGTAAACGFSLPGMSSRWALAVCMQCLKNDFEKGLARWHTAHFVPGLALCPSHLEPLLTYCNRCKSGFRHSREVWQPRLECVCGGELQPVRVLATESERKVEVAIAKMVRQILKEEALTTLGHDDLLSAICLRAKQMGYGKIGSFIKIKKLVEQKIGTKTLAVYKFGTSKRHVFRKSLAGIRLPRNPIHNLLLIHALFGGLEELTSFLSSGTISPFYFNEFQDGALEKPDRKRPDRYRHWYQTAEEEFYEIRHRFQEQLLKLKREIPSLTRSQLSSLGAKDAYAFFCRYDKQWLDKTIPCAPFAPKSTEHRKRWQIQRDDLLASHIRMRHDVLMNSSSTLRITHRRLLDGQPLQDRSKKYFEQFPNTRLALKECTETLEDWRARQLETLLDKAFSVSSNAPFNRNVKVRDLSFNQFRKLKEMIRKWVKRQVRDF